MRILILSASAVALTACSSAALDAPQSPTFGLAVASMQSQILATEVSDLPPESSGHRAAAAIARYEKGEVRKLDAQTTSNLTINLVPVAK